MRLAEVQWKSQNRGIFLLLPLLLFWGCGIPELPPIKNLNNGKIIVLGHAGAGLSKWINPIPGDTEESIRVGIEELGADGVEIDVQLSNDRIPVLFHSEKLEAETDCKGGVSEKSASEIQQCHYSSEFLQFDGKNYAIPELKSVFRNYSVTSSVSSVSSVSRLLSSCAL